jgi:putative lipoic acid-binding regulatory protein
MHLLEGRPEIEYPCPWNFKIIGQNETLMRLAIAEIVGSQTHTLVLSKYSAQGNYCSLDLKMVVQSEPHRVETYTALVQHQNIKIVL